MRLARVINNSAALLMLDLLSKAVPLVVFPAVVRALGPTAYGKVGFATAVAGFFGLLASPGFTTYAAREAAKDESRVNFLVQHVLGARIAFGVLSYALLIVFALTFAPHDFTTRLLIVLSGLIFLVSSVDVQWIFTARSRMWMVALRGAVGQLVYGGVILAFIRSPSDAWIVPVAGVASLVAGMFLIWLPARREYRVPWPVISPGVWRSFLPVCLIMGFASMMSMIYDQIDTVMLRYMRSEKELGLYVASYSMMAISLSFAAILGQVFFPLLSQTTGQDREQDRENEQRYLGWLWQASIGLALPIATGGFILAEPLTRFVLGSQYSWGGNAFSLAYADHRSRFDGQLFRSSTDPDWAGKEISDRRRRGGGGERSLESVSDSTLRRDCCRFHHRDQPGRGRLLQLLFCARPAMAKFAGSAGTLRDRIRHYGGRAAGSPFSVLVACRAPGRVGCLCLFCCLLGWPGTEESPADLNW